MEDADTGYIKSCACGKRKFVVGPNNETYVCEQCEEIEGLKSHVMCLISRNKKLQEFAEESLCDCYDEYGGFRPSQCHRCYALGYEWPNK